MKRFISMILVIAIVILVLPVPAFAADSCRHSRTKQNCYRTEYTEISSKHHLRERYYEEICKSCGEVVDEWVKEKERNHDFDGNVCEDCGYRKAYTIEELIEDEEAIVWYNGDDTIYVEGYETTWDYPPRNIGGTTMVPLTIAVEELGGEFDYWDADIGSAYVELDGDYIEFQTGTKSYWVNGRWKSAQQKAQIVNGKLYVAIKALTKITEQYVAYEDGYVVITNDEISDTQVEQIINYLYYGEEIEVEENEVEEKEEAVDKYAEIKAGNVYATSADGKHIYKRTYNANKAEQYEDIYDFTVFNIDLPKGTILTKEGSYLYADGTKAFALPDVIKQADKRISQLKRIIDGANNAYEAGAINQSRKNEIISTAQSSIDEYVAVAKGNKNLSNVSEVKKSYVAKTGTNSDTVKTIQQKLVELGFTSQKITGNYADITFNNVAYFQIVNDLAVTGWVDNSTYNKVMYEEKPEAEIVEILSDRDGNLMVHAIGNVQTERLKICVSGNGFYDSTEVDDCECWFSTETPQSGDYIVWAVATSSNGTVANTEEITVNVSKYTILQKVFEDMAEEQQIKYELQAGVLVGFTRKMVIEPTNTLVTAIDYVINSPNYASVQRHESERSKILEEVENYIESAMPYGTEYYHVGQMVGNGTSIAVNAVLLINGVETVVQGIKTLPSGMKVIEVVGNAGVQCIVIDAEALALSASTVATGAIEVSVAVVSMASLGDNDSGTSGTQQETVNEKPSSKTLAKNMEKVGRMRPSNYPTAAHHIVAGTSQKATRARAILEKFGVSINDEANGVFLTTQKGSTYSAYHPSLHDKEYYDKVNVMLEYAKSREDVIAILRDIAEDLLNRTF